MSYSKEDIIRMVKEEDVEFILPSIHRHFRSAQERGHHRISD